MRRINEQTRFRKQFIKSNTVNKKSPLLKGKKEKNKQHSKQWGK